MAQPLRLLTTLAPPVEPLGLDEAKAHLRLELSDDDALVGALIQSAREACERFTGRALVERTLTLFLDAWPAAEASLHEGWREGALIERGRRWIALPRPPLLAVELVTLYDDQDQGTTWGAENYFVDTASEPGRLVVRSGLAQPSATRAANGIEIRYRVGYAPDESGSPSDYRVNIPQALRDGMKRLVAHLYEQRGDTADLALRPSGAEALWTPFRVMRL